MTQDISNVTKPSAGEKEKSPPAKEFFIVEILKKLLEFNNMKWGIKKKF